MSDTDFDIDAAMAEIPDGETAPAAVSSPIGGGHTPAPNDGVAAPTAPLVATHDARAEDAQDDPDAMVVISGNPTMRDADGKRITFEKKQIVLAYAPVACKAGINEIPDDGFGADAGWGNFYAYVSEADATKFTKECGGVLHARGHDGEMHALKVKACKIDYDAAPTLAKGLARSTVANLSVHLIADLDNGAMFRMVKKHHLVEALKAKGFVVFKTSREYLQLDEQNRTQIDGLETNSIHINVRPRMGTITEAKWPGVIEAKVKNRFTDHERLFFVKYKIKSHSLLSKTLCINKCKQDPCACGNPDKRKAQEPAKGEPPVKKTRKQEQQSVLSTFLATALGDKSGTPCQFYKDGLCRRARSGSVCPFLHDPSVHVADIMCRLPWSKHGNVCQNGKTCAMKHGERPAGNPWKRARAPSHGSNAASDAASSDL